MLDMPAGAVGGAVFALGLAVPVARYVWRHRQRALKVLADPRFAMAPRLRLERLEQARTHEAFRKLWAQCEELGFRALGDYADPRAYRLLRMARHETWNVAVVAGEDARGQAMFAMFHVGADGRMTAAGSGLEPALATDTLSWSAYSAVTPGSLWSDMRNGAGDSASLVPDLLLVKRAFETLYAARVDAAIAQPPSLGALQQRAAARGLRPGDVALAALHAAEYARWLAQVAAAALDHFRHDTRANPGEWERRQASLHLVHDRMRSSDVAALVGTAAPLPQLQAQLERQGLSGIALYERLVQYLPSREGRFLAGTVSAPLPAAVYAPDPLARSRPAVEFAYRAAGARGRRAGGTVFAHDVPDALRQLDAMGLRDVKVLNDPVIGEELKVIDDPASAELDTRDAHRPLWLAMLGAAWEHRWIWGSSLALLAWTLSAGVAYTMVGYVSIVYAIMAMTWTLCYVLPVAAYRLLQQARVYADWPRAQFCLSLVEAFNPFGTISALQVLAEETKIMAGRGEAAEALLLWKQGAHRASPAEYAHGLMSIHSIAGDVPGMIAAQRRLYDLAPDDELLALDLALSLARYEGAIDEAQRLVARITPDRLSALPLGGYHYVRGLICAEQQQWEFAIKQYGQAMEVLGRLKGHPLSAGMAAEIRGFAALALKASGRRHEARSVWSSALPVVQGDALLKNLIARYEAA